MTTEPRPRPREARLAGISVRTRLTAAVALLTGLALGATGLLVYTLESARLENDVRAQIDQELAEFDQLRSGQDPETARATSRPQTLIRLFLRRNVPGSDEVLVGWWDGRPQVSSAGSSHPGLVRDPAFLDLVERRLERGGSEELAMEYGEVLVTVAPVRNSTTRGALVVAHFLTDAKAELSRVMQTYAAVSVLLLIAVSGTAAWQAGRLLAPLRELRRTAQEITETDLSRRLVAAGNDDITALTRTFNEMLSRLEDAFTSQRDFLDDASHELRTPLTVLRGHLELMDAQDPIDVAGTRALLLDELDRMSRLVEELIWLTKTERPGFFAMRPVPLEPFMLSVLDKCRALGPREWTFDGCPDVQVRMDDHRVTQLLLQLAHNAVKHTGEGDQIGIGAAVGPEGLVELRVRDTGHGVAPEDRDRIFRRFARGETSPDDEGFGLGLAIVSAIARAHGGTVEVRDTPGGGATFTMVMPGHRLDQRKEVPAWQGS